LAQSEKSVEEAKPKEVKYEACIVTFIDILGFRTLVTDRSAADVHRTIKALERFTKPHDSAIGPEDTGLISQAYAQSVSDAVVRIRPYQTRYRDGALIREIIDLLHAQMELVNLGVLIRAGVTIGDACVPAKGDGPVFGPAMVRAYEIESQEAIYPRIVIDDDALKQHALDPLLRSDSNSLADEQKMLGQLLAVGDDGTRYIDYLAAEGEFDYPELYLEFLQTHAKLIRTGRSDNTNRSVRRKYDWLAVYHNKRVDGIRKGLLSNRQRMVTFYEEYEVEPQDFLDSIAV
jgi:hypothetical protein